jgi:hypothetical protein
MRARAGRIVERTATPGARRALLTALSPDDAIEPTIGGVLHAAGARGAITREQMYRP